MKNIVTVTIKLLIITLIAGALLGVVYSVTKEPIAQQMEKAATEARLMAFPDAADFEDAGTTIPEEYSIIKSAYYAKDAAGNVIGATFGIVTRGFSSGLNLTVGIGAHGKIKGVIVGDNAETPGLGKKAAEPNFSGQFAGKNAEPLQVQKVASDENDIQAITGATVTSRAITDAVNAAIEYYTQLAGGAK